MSSKDVVITIDEGTLYVAQAILCVERGVDFVPPEEVGDLMKQAVSRLLKEQEEDADAQ